MLNWKKFGQEALFSSAYECLINNQAFIWLTFFQIQRRIQHILQL